MSEEEKKFNPWEVDANKGESEGKKFSFVKLLKLSCWSISNTFLGFAGLVVFILSLFLIFRHGTGLADLSYLELGWFFWMYFCLSRIKGSVGILNKQGMKAVFSIFYSIGLIGFWIGVVMLVLSFQKLIFLRESFLASNTAELGSLFVVFMGFGLVALKNENPLETSGVDAS